LSGKSSSILDGKKRKNSLENIFFVITDDLNLSLELFLWDKGSDGGHNGLKILIVLNTKIMVSFWY
jgi:peptidyl-tRNA hydrolase